MVKNPPAMRETQVQSLGQEDSLDKRMATHSRILAEEFHGQGSLAGYSPWGCKESDMTEQLTRSLSTSVGRSIGKKVNRLSFQQGENCKSPGSQSTAKRDGTMGSARFGAMEAARET